MNSIRAILAMLNVWEHWIHAAKTAARPFLIIWQSSKNVHCYLFAYLFVSPYTWERRAIGYISWFFSVTPVLNSERDGPQRVFKLEPLTHKFRQMGIPYNKKNNFGACWIEGKREGKRSPLSQVISSEPSTMWNKLVGSDVPGGLRLTSLNGWLIPDLQEPRD